MTDALKEIDSAKVWPSLTATELAAREEMFTQSIANEIHGLVDKFRLETARLILQRLRVKKEIVEQTIITDAEGRN